MSLLKNKEKELTLSEIVESLTSSEIEEITNACDASGMCYAITLWAQFSKKEKEEFFTKKYKPLSNIYIPERYENKKIFYSLIAKRLVSEWKNEPENKALRSKAKQFIEFSAQELFFPKTYAQELMSDGHLVSEGIVYGMDPDYLKLLFEFSEDKNINLSELKNKIGGLTIDILTRAKSSLILDTKEVEFIDGFIALYRKSKIFKDHKIKTLRMAQEVRKYYIDSGLNLEDFMKLWGINKTAAETKKILLEEASFGNSRTKLSVEVDKLTKVDKLKKDETVTGSEAMQLRAKQLNLPKKLLSPEEMEVKIQKIINKIQGIMNYEEITGKSIDPNNIIITGAPGTRSRPANITYLNSKGKTVNVQIMGGHSPAQQLLQMFGHEFTHELHAILVSNGQDLEKWNKIDSGIREQFAKMVEKSFMAVYKDENQTENSDESGDSYRPALVEWFNFVYGYGQLAFLEKICEGSGKLSDEALLAVEAEISGVIKELNYISSTEGTNLDLRLREWLLSMLEPNDGIRYCIPSINAYNALISQQIQENESVLNPMEATFGKAWILDPVALKILVFVMIKSPDFKDTNDVVAFMQELCDKYNKSKI